MPYVDNIVIIKIRTNGFFSDGDKTYCRLNRKSNVEKINPIYGIRITYVRRIMKVTAGNAYAVQSHFSLLPLRKDKRIRRTESVNKLQLIYLGYDAGPSKSHLLPLGSKFACHIMIDERIVIPVPKAVSLFTTSTPFLYSHFKILGRETLVALPAQFSSSSVC